MRQEAQADVPRIEVRVFDLTATKRYTIRSTR